MDITEWLLGTLTTITLALSGWALTRINKQESAMAAMDARTTVVETSIHDTVTNLTEQNKLLQEVRDTMMSLSMALSGSSSSDGLLDQFKRFSDKFDDRSQKNEQLTRDLDKRLALLELHFQYYMPRNNDHPRT